MIRLGGKRGFGWVFALLLVASLGQLIPANVVAQDGGAARATTYKALPQVRLIQSEEPIPADDGRASWPWEFVFEDAARFAWVGFDALGGQLERDVVVIYEGMTVRVDRNGRYEVRFRAEAPRMPVTLRMQLKFCGTGAMDCPGTITLPPIRIEPDQANERSSVDSLTHEVVYVGHSESLRRLGRTVLAAEETRTANDLEAKKKAALAQINREIANAEARIQSAKVRKTRIEDETEYREAFLRLEKAKVANGVAQKALSDAEQTVKQVDVRLQEAKPSLQKKATSNSTPPKNLESGEKGTLVEGAKPAEDLEQIRIQAQSVLMQKKTEASRAATELNAATVGYSNSHPKSAAAQRAVVELQKAMDHEGKKIGELKDEIANLDFSPPATPRSLHDDVRVIFTRSGTARFGSIPPK